MFRAHRKLADMKAALEVARAALAEAVAKIEKLRDQVRRLGGEPDA